MNIPKVLFFDDNFAVTDSNGNQLPKDQLISLRDKIDRVLLEGCGHLEKEGFVYFVKGSNNLIKIGCTGNVKARLSAIKSTNGKAELVRLMSATNMVNLERSLHIFFSKKRVVGEWFELSFDDVLKYEISDIDKLFGAEDVCING